MTDGLGSRRTTRNAALWLCLAGASGCTMDLEQASDHDAVAATEQALAAGSGGQAGDEEFDDVATAADTGELLPSELVDLALQSDRTRIAPRTYVPFEKPATVDFTGRVRDRIVVKFVEGSHVRLRGDRLAIELGGITAAVDAGEVARLSRSGFTRSSARAALADVENILAAFPSVKIERSFSLTETQLDVLKASGEANAGIELADLNLSYNVHVEEADAPALLAALNASDFVEIAYPAPIYYDGAVDTPPTTQSYVASQGYLNRAPAYITETALSGVDARFAWTRTGGSGSNVLVFDIEHNWNTLHEDLGAGGNNGPSHVLGYACGNAQSAAFNCPAGAPCHGNAVLGIIRGTNNMFGVTGVAHTAAYGTSSVWQQGPCTGTTSVGNALLVAAFVAQPGDVFLIEVQASPFLLCPNNGSDPCSPGTPACASDYGRLPSEWITDTFNAIQTVTANGRVVVEIAGNGEQNLDDVRYNNYWNRATRDSGAILVGAGSSTTRQPQCFSNFGSRVDVQAWGNGVRTLGYSDIQVNGADQTQWYATGFTGTSAAGAIVAGAAAAVQGACKAGNVQTICTTAGQTLPSYGTFGSFGMRELLTVTGTPQPTPVTSQIGPLPNLRAATALLEPPAMGATAAAKWTSTKSAVFAVDSIGGLKLRSKTGSDPWTAPAVIDGATSGFPPGAPIATGFPVSSELRVFSATTSGQLRYSRSSSGGVFTTMSAISALNAAPVFANLATGIRNTNQLHVFFVDASSRLVAFHATGTGTIWTGPVIIANNFAPPGAPLATGRQGTNQLDVFAIGSDGALKVAWALDGGNWNAPFNLSATNVAPSWNPNTRFGGGVATGVQGTNQLDVFFVGNNQILQVAWVVGQGAWLGPVNLHGTATFNAGAPISTGKHGSSNNTLDVFAKAFDNSLKLLRVVGTGSWSGPTTVTNTSGQTIDSWFSATANRETSSFDLFAIGSNGLSIATASNGGSYGTFSKMP